MPKRNLVWIAVGGVVAILLWQVPRVLDERDALYNKFSPLLDVRAQILKHYAEPVEHEALLRGAIDGMIERLDPYSQYFDSEEFERFDKMMEGQFEGIGIAVEKHESGHIVVISPIEGSPAFQAGLRAGDRITMIEGAKTSEMTLEQGVAMIKNGASGTKVKLTVYRPTSDETFEREVARELVMVPTVRGWARTRNWEWDYMIDPDLKIGYVRIRSFEGNTGQQFDAVVRQLLTERGMAGLVIDVRDNPGGLLKVVVGIVNHFISDGVIVSTQGRNTQKEIFRASQEGTYPPVPLAILVNHGSASASEILAGSLRDHNRAVVVGEQTFGKGSVQQFFPIEANGGAVKITIGYYYLPRGERIHGRGVEPTVVVELSADERSELLDSQLQVYSTSALPESQPATSSAPADERRAIIIDRQLRAALAAVKVQLSKAGNN